MEINNKYQIGQKVFFLNNGKAKCDEVKSITFFVYKDSVNIMYGFQKDVWLSEGFVKPLRARGVRDGKCPERIGVW